MAHTGQVFADPGGTVAILWDLNITLELGHNAKTEQLLVLISNSLEMFPIFCLQQDVKICKDMVLLVIVEIAEETNQGMFKSLADEIS